MGYLLHACSAQFLSVVGAAFGMLLYYARAKVKRCSARHAARDERQEQAEQARHQREEEMKQARHDLVLKRIALEKEQMDEPKAIKEA